jgi:hypothetical protein
MAKPLALAGLALTLAGGLVPVAHAQDLAGQFGVAPQAQPEWTFEPLSKLLGVRVPGVPMVALDALDHAALIQADSVNPPMGKVLRVALGRPLAIDQQMGSWTATPDGGSLWTIDLRATGAEGLRVGFTQMNLPPGVLLCAYNPLVQGDGSGPYTGAGDAGLGEQFSATIWADTARVELYLPPGAARVLPMKIDNLQHFYRRLSMPPAAAQNPGEGEPVGTVGNCHNDVTCTAAWANPARAVAIYFISGPSGTGQCTGQLLANNTADLTPYFLTASHCGDSASEVASYDCYWLYQTSTCNGAVPTLASRPRTTGATLIGTRGQSDGTLARLTGILPGGLFYQGWSATAVNTGANQAVAAIHHPDGSWKRLSFGNINSSAIYCGAGDGQLPGESYRVQWTSGVTEGGSSGSGILRTDNQLLVGMLSCGSSFCGTSTSNLNDIYGRFSTFYANVAAVSTALTGGFPDDSQEPNDTCVAPRDLSLTTAFSQTGLVVKLVDEDHYRVTVGNGQTLTVGLTFNAGQGNIDTQLLDDCVIVLASGVSNATGETLTWTNNTGAPAQVGLRVFLNGTTPVNTYAMTASLSGVPVGPQAQNACASAQNITAGQTYTGTTVGATQDGSAACITTQRPDVWYGFVAPVNGTLRLDTCTSAIDTVLSLHTACGNASVVCNDDAAAGVGPCGSGTNRTSFVTRSMAGGERVLIRVAAFGATGGAFTLRVAFDAATPPANDLCANAQTVGVGAFAFDTTNAATDGPSEAGCALGFAHNGIDKDIWYAFNAPGTGILNVETCGTAWDTKLGVYAGPACPSVPDTIQACNDDAATQCAVGATASRLSTAVVGGTRYLIRVGGYRNASGVVANGVGTLTIGFVVTACGPSDIASPGPTVGSDGELTADDIILFVNWFTSGDPRGDIAGPGPTPGADGEFTADDVILFINRFTQSC